MAELEAQLGNATDIVGWQPNPLTRGTADILSTCIITLSLCIWSALHLNVAGSDGWYARLWAKIFWLLLCLVAPELVAAVALTQRNQAKLLAKNMNTKLGLTRPPGPIAHARSAIISRYRALRQFVSNSKVHQDSLHELDEENGSTLPTTSSNQQPTSGNRKHPWTLKHGFFAGMGGFGLHIPPGLPDDVRFLPDPTDEARFITTPQAMEFLAGFPDAHKDIPDLSINEIDALSRASAFAKFLVCCQATWFICQAILRLSHHLPISLLELNTLAHAICVLLTYLFWWDKPFDVEQPVYLRSRFLYPAAANLQARTSKSSVTKLWVEQATQFIIEQERHYQLCPRWRLHPSLVTSPCSNLKDYFQEPLHDGHILQRPPGPVEEDQDAFIRFCTREINDTPRSPMIPVSWAGTLPGTDFRLRTTVPTFCFRNASPIFLPGFPFKSWKRLKTHLISFLQQPPGSARTSIAKAFMPFMFLYGLSWFLSFRMAMPQTSWLQATCIVAFLPMIAVAIIPQARRLWLSWLGRGDESPVTNRDDQDRFGKAWDVFNSAWVTKGPLDTGGTVPPPADIAAFLETSEAVMEINTVDANLMEATWQHYQIGSSGLLSPTRLGEASGLDFSGHFMQDVWLLAPFIVYTAVYGGIHFVGLEAPFRDEVMRTLWMASSVTVTTGLAAAALVGYPAIWMFRKVYMLFQNSVLPKLRCRLATRPVLKRYMGYAQTLLGIGFFLIVAWIAGGLLLLYLGARFFLLVESFIALTHQPRAVYEVRPWAAYWPHIS